LSEKGFERMLMGEFMESDDGDRTNGGDDRWRERREKSIGKGTTLSLLRGA